MRVLVLGLGYWPADHGINEIDKPKQGGLRPVSILGFDPWRRCAPWTRAGSFPKSSHRLALHDGGHLGASNNLMFEGAVQLRGLADDGGQ